MLKKIAKKNKNICPGPPPHEQIFFLWGTKGKKTSFGASNGKNFLWGTKRGLKKGSFYFLWSPKGSFFSHLVPQRKFFPFGTPKEKKCSRGGGPGQFFLFFWQYFSQCEKITQFLEFCKYQGGKI